MITLGEPSTGKSQFAPYLAYSIGKRMFTLHFEVMKKHFTFIILKMNKWKLECKIQNRNIYLRLGKISLVLGWRKLQNDEVVQ